MSQTTAPSNPVAATNAVISVADTAPQAIAGIKTAFPALYALMLGSPTTYGRAFIAPVVGAGVGLLVSRYALACAAGVTTGCWTPDTVSAVTDIISTLCGGLAALVMHWISKAPARVMVNSVVPVGGAVKS